MTEKKKGPDATGVVHERQEAAVTLVRDVMGGTARMREAGGTYLPQFPREENDGYAARLKTAVLFNATKQTVKGLTGMILRKPPELGEDTPDEILEHLENIDLQGRGFFMQPHRVSVFACLESLARTLAFDRAQGFPGLLSLFSGLFFGS